MNLIKGSGDAKTGQLEKRAIEIAEQDEQTFAAPLFCLTNFRFAPNRSSNGTNFTIRCQNPAISFVPGNFFSHSICVMAARGEAMFSRRVKSFMLLSSVRLRVRLARGELGARVSILL